jgi:formamidopyrimidine-DNA glycosylase
VPELPEVEVVRRGLAAHVLGRTVEAVEVLHARPVRRHLPGPDDFAARMTGRVFTAARRRGKYLWLPLAESSEAGGDALLAHLGMSGQLLVQPPDAPAERHLRVRFRLGPEGGRPPLDLRFVDQRMFGGLSFSPAGADLPAELSHIARDPLDPEFDDDAFVAKVRRRASGVKRQLLDQNLISGVGNIYADESLWRAQVNGARLAETLTKPKLAALLDHATDVMRDALSQGGTSFDSLYVNVNGESGYFDRSLDAYGREGEPCRRCGAVMRREKFMNRSSYYCPKCQPRPRR